MGKFLCRVFAVVVLLGAVVNMSVVFKNSPAFNSSERLESVAGGWRVPNVAAHYDKAEYQQELAYGYLNDLGLSYDPEIQQTVFIDEEEMNARAAKAFELIDQVILLDPSNATAWTYRAQAQYQINDIAAMRDSLVRSWALAPNNLRLADLRLSLVAAINQKYMKAPEDITALSAEEVSSVHRDRENLQAQQPRYFAQLIERSEPIRRLLNDLDRSDQPGS